MSNRLFNVRVNCFINQVVHWIDITVQANRKFGTRLSNLIDHHQLITEDEQSVRMNERFKN